MAIAAVAGLVLGAPLSAPLASRVEKRTMIIIGMIGMVVDQAGPVTLRLLGFLPLTGTDLAIALAVAAFLGSIFTGLTVISALSIIPDAADEHEYLYGTRREGLYTAGWAFAGKAATGAGILIAGVVLDLVSFPTGISHQGSAGSIPTWAANTLALVGGPGASLLSMAAIILVLFYRIDKCTHAHIMADLNARRAAAAEKTASDAP
jgi:glycoside/pentoside/hexuronide:cation symporter, GPH family